MEKSLESDKSSATFVQAREEVDVCAADLSHFKQKVVFLMYGGAPGPLSQLSNSLSGDQSSSRALSVAIFFPADPAIARN